MKYTFVGDGMGIPGLPHEISEEEAEQQGVANLLKAAIENGSYVAIVQGDPTSPAVEAQMEEPPTSPATEVQVEGPPTDDPAEDEKRTTKKRKE